MEGGRGANAFHPAGFSAHRNVRASVVINRRHDWLTSNIRGYDFGLPRVAAAVLGTQ